MHRILIAEAESDLRGDLSTAFCRNYETRTCSDGAAALELLRSEKPDVLIIDTELPEIDGLTVLRKAGTDRPPVILCISTLNSYYVSQSAQELGAWLTLTKPFRMEFALSHVENMLRLLQEPVKRDPQSIIAHHLDRLGANIQLLRVGISLFAQDPEQKLIKELYPAIAQRCEGESTGLIGKAIERAIKAAWKNRDSQVWEEYFPDAVKCPTNKVFIKQLADFLAE